MTLKEATTIERICAERDQLRAEVAALQAELAEARKDGERWAFVRKHADMFRISARGKMKKRYSVHVAFTNYEYDVFPTIDEAMDATMRGTR